MADICTSFCDLINFSESSNPDKNAILGEIDILESLSEKIAITHSENTHRSKKILQFVVQMKKEIDSIKEEPYAISTSRILEPFKENIIKSLVHLNSKVDSKPNTKGNFNDIRVSSTIGSQISTKSTLNDIVSRDCIKGKGDQGIYEDFDFIEEENSQYEPNLKFGSQKLRNIASLKYLEDMNILIKL